MKPPGGYVGEALRDCGAIKPRKRMTAGEAARKYAQNLNKELGMTSDVAARATARVYLAGVRFAQRLAKREGK